MSVLFENPVPIYAVGAVLTTLCGLTFLVRRSLRSLLALAGVVAAAALRLGGGEPLVDLPSWLPYPEHFPFRTTAMLAGLATIPLVSLATARFQVPRPLARNP